MSRAGNVLRRVLDELTGGPSARAGATDLVRLSKLVEASHEREREQRQFFEDVQQELDILVLVKRVLARYPEILSGPETQEMIGEIRQIMED